MITSAELNKAGAMVQSTDGAGWGNLASEHGDKVLLDAIVHLTKKRGQPTPLSAVRAYLRPVAKPASKTAEPAPKESPVPDATTTDPLLDALAKPGLAQKIADALQIHNSAVYQWKRTGKIPGRRREAVEEIVRQVEKHGDSWAPPAPPKREEKEKPTRRSQSARTTLEAVAKGLGIEVVPVYVVKGDRLVERQGVVW